jgi:hypothetical protein
MPHTSTNRKMGALRCQTAADKLQGKQLTRQYGELHERHATAANKFGPRESNGPNAGSNDKSESRESNGESEPPRKQRQM